MHFFSAELSLPLSDSESLPRFDSCPPAHSREDERDAKGLAELNSLLILQPTFEDVFQERKGSEFSASYEHTELTKSLRTWLRECSRQVEAEVVSNSRNKLHQTTYEDFLSALYVSNRCALPVDVVQSGQFRPARSFAARWLLRLVLRGGMPGLTLIF